MKLKKVGFFRELRHGDENGPSLKTCIRSEPQEDEAKIINYLKSGICFISCSGITQDVLDPSSEFRIPPHILTDGVWAWPQDIVYYVQKYHAQLPSIFVDHMKSNNWTVISENKMDLLTLELE